MPVIVIGADAAAGPEIVSALLGREGEVRAFVTDPAVASELRERGVKVATGDVSDGSHVGGAALGAFSAVTVVAASTDGRERAFAPDPGAVVAAWAEGLRDAGIRRLIVVPEPGVDTTRLLRAAPEHAVVTSRDVAGIAAEVARLDELAEL